MKPASLQQRLVFFILVPVAFLLLAMGWVGLFYAKHSLLNQWAEASKLKLQRAAHFVDMQLKLPKDLLEMFEGIGDTPSGDSVREFLLQRIREAGGVVRVDLVATNTDRGGNKTPESPMSRAMGAGRQMMRGNAMGMPFRRASFLEVTPPRYDPSTDGRTIAIVSELEDAEDRAVGRIEVHIEFDSLVGAVESTGWWRSHKAYIIDSKGKVLASNLAAKGKGFADDAADPDSLEKSTLRQMEKMPYGTIFGEGLSPKEVAGFYRLHEAPWTLVIIAPGDEVLAAILRFQAIYVVTGAIFMVVILVLIRLVAGRVVSSIRKVSLAADRVAGGRYDISLETDSRDEIGDLFQSFNRMAVQLEERARMKSALNLAMEVQRNLLPQETVGFDFLDIAGRSVYCDEVGGDYYDFLQIPSRGPACIGVAVGDVTGHGVPAALLMTTARALISSRAEQQGDLAAILDDVNRLLCRDTSSSGHFMTLFFMALDNARGEIRWARAGHDPALVYDPAADAFTELDGEGMALGVDPAFRYVENVYSGWAEGQIAVVATDGVWETEGELGERFGKQRLQQAVRRHHAKSAAQILDAVIEEVAAFRKGQAVEDDVTLVIVKALEAGDGKGRYPSELS